MPRKAQTGSTNRPFEIRNHLFHESVNVILSAPEHNLGVDRRFIVRIDPCEIPEFASTCLLLKALGVPCLTYIQGCVDKNLNKLSILHQGPGHGSLGLER